jgi:hypothetical protein
MDTEIAGDLRNMIYMSDRKITQIIDQFIHFEDCITVK